MNHFFSIILILTLLSCYNSQKEPFILTKEYYEAKNCIEKYGFCDGIIKRIKNNDIPSKVLAAKWEFRNQKYSQALETLKSVEIDVLKLPLQSPLFQEYLLLKIDCYQNLHTYDIKFVNDILKQIDPGDKLLTNFYCELLLRKSNALRENNYPNHSIVTSILALEILSNNENLVNNIGKQEYYHAINLFREQKFDAAAFFFDTANSKCSDITNPLCRKIRTLKKVYIDKNPNKRFLEELYGENFNQYTPSVDKYIETIITHHFSNKQASFISNKLEKILSSENICNEDFYNALYLIDALLELNNLVKAMDILDKLIKCEIYFSNQEYITRIRKQRLLFKRYEQSGKLKDLKEAYSAIKVTNELAQKRFGTYQNLHYADFMASSNESLLECLYHLQSTKTIGSDSIINDLSQIKRLYNNLSSLQELINNLPKKDLERYIHAIEEIEKLELQTNECSDTTFLDYKMYNKLNDLYELIYEIKSKYPLQRRISYEEKRLDPNTQIIEISASTNNYYFSFIYDNQIKITKHKREVIDSLFEISIFQNDSLIQNKPLNTLASRIIKPNLNYSKNNLVIIPDQKFYSFPFEQIPLSLKNSKSPAHLCDNFTISYDYNINNAVKYQKTSVVKNALLASYSDSISMAQRNELLAPKQPLGWKEIKAIKNFYSNANILSGNNFTKTKFRGLSDYGVIHISTHSTYEPDNMLDNYLLLRNSEFGTVKLYGFELKFEKLNNSIVILSSCHSGSGVFKKGTGVYAISRNILKAGASCVIKSLWNVNEKSTKELMVYFHQKLNEGYSAGQSLNMAKRYLKSKQEYSNPYYWSGFILEGNPNIYLNEVEY